MEMAHRLSQTPGKCQQVHGHSWWVELEIRGSVDVNGMILEFGDVKRHFRSMIDNVFDHKLLLNRNDPLMAWPKLPGATGFPSDPTTENVAKDIYNWARAFFAGDFEFKVTVWETSVNCATWGDF